MTAPTTRRYVDPEVAKRRGRLAKATRDGKPTAELKRDLRAANLAKHIREVVDAAPPLTEDQCRELRALLVPGGAV